MNVYWCLAGSPPTRTLFRLYTRTQTSNQQYFGQKMCQYKQCWGGVERASTHRVPIANQTMSAHSSSIRKTKNSRNIGRSMSAYSIETIYFHPLLCCVSADTDRWTVKSMGVLFCKKELLFFFSYRTKSILYWYVYLFDNVWALSTVFIPFFFLAFVCVQISFVCRDNGQDTKNKRIHITNIRGPEIVRGKTIVYIPIRILFVWIKG